MRLSWLGISSFKIETKGAALVTDPYSPSVSKKPLRAKADIVTVSSADDPAHNHVEGISGEPFVIDHPGEFEVRGMYIQGMEAEGGGRERAEERGKAAKENGGTAAAERPTMFLIDAEGMRLAHLGDLRDAPTDAEIERMNGVDVLFLPVGGGPTLGAQRAANLLHDIEPRIVVPMHYAQTGMNLGTKLAPVSSFLAIMGALRVSPVASLLLKKKDLPTEEDVRVVIFQS